MHMISKKDLNSAEKDTWTKIVSSCDCHDRQWRSANAWRGNCVCQKNWVYSWLWKVPRGIRQQYLSLGKLCDEKRIFLRIDQRSKKHIWKRDSDTMQHGELRSDRGSRLVIEFFLQFFPLQHLWHLQGRRLIILRLPRARSTSPTTNCVKRQWD